MAEPERVRAQGFAQIEQKVEDGLRSIAVPMLNARGRVVAALDAGWRLPARPKPCNRCICHR
ncbi:IclR family transcriptional regulator domain-containing protein [Xinfangfangia pollutisoli]|uniref:IclR family transcriptional regulator domain-containing protein n=1 Tax=Xinfangfangia pollutisoli TaxID=2865960 RepID=UPI0021E5F2FB|nr:IclR family transcriptional regulator C-terminal domain-containing protein [Xinfangfangia pollutisoli]